MVVASGETSARQIMRPPRGRHYPNGQTPGRSLRQTATARFFGRRVWSPILLHAPRAGRLEPAALVPRTSALAVTRWRARGRCCARFCGEGAGGFAAAVARRPQAGCATRDFGGVEQFRHADEPKHGVSVPDVGLEAEPLFTAQIAPRLRLHSPGDRVTARARGTQADLMRAECAPKAPARPRPSNSGTRCTAR